MSTGVTKIKVEKFGSIVAGLTEYLNNVYVCKCVRMSSCNFKRRLSPPQSRAITSYNDSIKRTKESL